MIFFMRLWILMMWLVSLFNRKKEKKPDIRVVQCQTCRKEQETDVSKPSTEWPICHSRTMPVKHLKLKRPDVPFQCPRCGSGGVREKGMGSFNDDDAVQYRCGTILCSYGGEPWYVAMKSCVKWDWESK